MYSNYSWSSQSSNPFELQQQELSPLTLPLTPTTTTNDSSNLQENQSPQLIIENEGNKLNDLKNRIKIKLVEEKLFNKFKDLPLEMVISKAGRNLFPKLNFVVEGLEPDNCYLFYIMFKRVENLKYKYTNNQWIKNVPADDEYPEQKEFPHSANTQFQNGKKWMESEISFTTLKLTNNQQNSCKNAVVLRSLHKYCPVLIIYRYEPENSTFTRFIEEEITCSTFISVTAYQNSAVSQLKIDNNPFAKGFRDGGRKRSRCYQSEESKSPPPAEQTHRQAAETNSLFSTTFFNTLNYIQNLYNPNMTSNELTENYYASVFQSQNLMPFNPQNFKYESQR